MAEIFLFTVLATVLGFYAAAAEHRRIRLTSGLWGGALGMITAAALLGLVLSLIAAIAVPALVTIGVIKAPDSSIEQLLAVADIAQLTSGLVVITIAAALFFRRRFKIRSDAALSRQLRRLGFAGQHAVLADLLMEHFTPLLNHPVAPAKDGMRIRQWLYEDPEATKKGITAWLRRIAAGARRRIAHTYQVACYRLANKAPKSAVVAQTLLVQSTFGETYPITTPDLGLQILEHPKALGFLRSDALFKFIEGLQRDTNSTLYWELQNNQNLRGRHRYDIAPQNRLLTALLTDPQVVDDIGAYRAIGDAVVAELRARRDLDYDDYRTAQSVDTVDWSEEFRHSINGAIRFFDIMVLESLYKKIVWHQWLYYLDFFTEEICHNFSLEAGADPDAEFPNAYARFLYEIVSAHCGWVDSIVDAARHNNVPTSLSPKDALDDHDKWGWIQSPDDDTMRGGNIPKAAIMSLISCHRRIITTDNIPDRFKRYITEMVLRQWQRLREESEYALAGFYARFFAKAIRDEGTKTWSGPYFDEFLQVRQDMRLELSIRWPSEFVEELDAILNE